MPPLTEKKKASNAKWDAAHLKRMSLAVPLDLFRQMQEHVAITGETVNGFIKRSIVETIERDSKARNKCNDNDEDTSKDLQDLMDFFESQNDILGVNRIVSTKDMPPPVQD